MTSTKIVSKGLCVAIILGGCTDIQTERLAPADVTSSRLDEVRTEPSRFSCKKDADCMNSCHHGAVNVTWYEREEALPGFIECEDGCANQVSAPPRCEVATCVAYQVDPRDEQRVSRRNECTRR
jgi:hypothetical protein